MTYVNFNGKIISQKKLSLTSENRAFRYGDAIFESIRMFDGNIPFIKKHFLRLKKSMKILQMLPKKNFSASYFEEQLKTLAQKNNFSNARFRLSIFRNDGGFYTPETNEISFLMEAFPLSENKFKLNSVGYKIGLFDEIQKINSSISSIKSANALLFVMASIYKTKHGLDECFILNDKKNISESITSNVFIVKNGKILTPSINEACVSGIMRDKLIEIAKKNKLIVLEKKISEQDILKADEVFLTNSINGIRWVSAYKNKRYNNKISFFLTEKLNDSL
ncbi:MAG: aminotransferase class IV [Bacteroidia bacterium]